MMRGRIAILGYGSLIWDLDDLAAHVAGGWAMGAGPALPLEFSRISPKRAMSLVVVIDPDCGAPCPTHAIASARDDPETAAEDLRRRERAPDAGMIGLVCARTGRSRAAHPATAARVAAWCAATGAAGAVWADLPRNFAEIARRPFDVEAGLAWLRALPPEGLAEAVRYIDGAPAATDTPLRRRLAADPWWLGLARP